MPVEVIVSSSNALLKEIRKAQEQGGLTERGWLIAEGPRLVDEAVRSGLRIRCLIASEETSWPENVEAERKIQIPERLYRSISGTATPQGILALAEPPQHTAEFLNAPSSLVLVLDRVQDPGNAGAMARSAEALGASGLIFLNGSAHPLSPKTLRASAGSLFRIPFLRSAGKLELPPGMPVFAGVADPQATAAWDCNLAQSCTIVVGNEGAGVSAELLRGARPVRIPTNGVESLNAAVAASLLLYEAARQRRVR